MLVSVIRVRERSDLVFFHQPEIHMKSNTSIASAAEQAIRTIPLNQLVLAPENVRKTSADKTAHAELKASIKAHGLLENLVVRPDSGSRTKGKFAVIAGGRRLKALNAIAAAGDFAKNRPIPCLVVDNEDAATELSLAENVVRVAMHPADQVVSFARLVREGATAASIAARFGVSERVVEQRLRLGNAAPELLDAYRAGEMDLEALKAFSMTADQDRQRTIWEQISTQGYNPSAWQVRRMLTEDRIYSASSMARFVGVDEYVAAGGQVMRDLFAEEGESGEWFDDPVLLRDLAMKKLTSAADELATKWKWALPLLEVDWTSAYEFGQIKPQPGKATAKEEADLGHINARMDELSEVPDEDWTDELETEAFKLEDRRDGIFAKIKKRAKFRPEDYSIGGCIVSIDREGKLEVIQGLVKVEDMPTPEDDKAGGKSSANDAEDTDSTDDGIDSHIRPPAISSSKASPSAKAREEAGIGIGLADDLRAIRVGIVKVHLAEDFEAAFDLTVFQAARSVFDHTHGGYRDALDLSFRPTPERPPVRMNHEEFASWSPSEDVLGDISSLPLQWMEEEDDGARFAALRKLPREQKEKLFAAAVARTVKGQLSFEYGARPELEATIAKLDIDFAKETRPTADLLWSRLRKDHLLAIAGKTLGGKWAQDRSKYRKADLAAAMEKAFSESADGGATVGLTAAQHEAALAWSMPGFQAFSGSEDAAADDVADTDPGPDPDPEPRELPGFLAEGD